MNRRRRPDSSDIRPFCHHHNTHYYGCMTTHAFTPQEETYIGRLGRALRCGNPDCACAPVPTQRLHCPVHPTAYVPTLSLDYHPHAGFSFTCSAGCSPRRIEAALARRGLPSEASLYTAAGAADAGLSPYELLIPQPTDWLWPNRIPMGELTILAGYPASGKTAVALDIAARVSLGGNTPDQPGAAFVRAPVVIAAPLKNPRSSLLPRLRDLGADLSVIYHADLHAPLHLADFSEDDHIESLDIVFEAERRYKRHYDRYEKPAALIAPDEPPPPPPKPREPPRGPSLRVAVNRLANFVARGSAALVVVDQIEHLALVHNARFPVVAGMLNSLAASTGAAVLALAHNPAHSLNAAARYMQPRLGMAGTVFTIALVGSDRARFLVPLSPPMHDALPPIPFNFHDAPPIAWREPVTPQRLTALSTPKPQKSRRTDMVAYACRFLADALAGGPKPVAELNRRAARLGISQYHLKRARTACKVKYTRVCPPGGPRGSGYWLYSLPEHDTPPSGWKVEQLNAEQGRGLLEQRFNRENGPALHESERPEERGGKIGPAAPSLSDCATIPPTNPEAHGA